MKIETIEVYKCEHCNKLYQRKHFAEKHEKLCKNNPDNIRSCHNCVHIYKKEYTLYFDNWSAEHESESERVVDLLRCDKINSFLYPPKVEIKGNAFDLGDDLNQPMLKECKHLKMYKELSYEGIFTF